LFVFKFPQRKCYFQLKKNLDVDSVPSSGIKLFELKLAVEKRQREKIQKIFQDPPLVHLFLSNPIWMRGEILLRTKKTNRRKNFTKRESKSSDGQPVT